MKLKKKLDKIEEGLKIKNWLPDYTVNKNVFRIALGVLFLLLFVALYTNDFSFSVQQMYFECVDEDVCDNPYYEYCNEFGFNYNEDVCKIVKSTGPDTLLKGQVFGKKPSWFLSNFNTVCFIVIVFAFLLNHFLYNKGYSFKDKFEEVDFDDKEFRD